MKQLGVLLACCVGGSLLSLLLRGLLPGNVLGLTLLLALLIFGAVRLHHVGIFLSARHAGRAGNLERHQK